MTTKASTDGPILCTTVVKKILSCCVMTSVTLTCDNTEELYRFLLSATGRCPIAE